MNRPTTGPTARDRFDPMMVKSDVLANLAGIRHGFFTREGGVSQGLYASLNSGIGSNDSRECVAENRARMAATLGCRPQDLLNAYQIHSPAVAVVEKPWAADTRPRADGLVTRVAGLAIAVSTADCGPVLLADAEARVIGAAHAGWRGALGGVVEATITAMEGLGASRPHIRAALGPMIRQPNYEVGSDLVTRFLDADPGNARFFSPAGRPNHAQFDLAGYITAKLAGAGIGGWDDLGLCTYADPARFFSFRRTTHRGEPDYGRHLNAIVLH
jgi:purine-nucleoside/S-methyl-5'-thioadenosine phosphorylase / adenosine deaminase